MTIGVQATRRPSAPLRLRKHAEACCALCDAAMKFFRIVPTNPLRIIPGADVFLLRLRQRKLRMKSDDVGLLGSGEEHPHKVIVERGESARLLMFEVL